MNFAEHAKSMGADAENVHSLTELEQAFSRAKKSNKTYIICIKTHGYQWLEGTAFWESPTLEKNKEAYNDFLKGKSKQRKGV